MKLPSIKNLFHQKASGKHSADFVVHPARDWKIIIWVSLGIGIVLILFSVYLSSRIQNDDAFQITPTNTAPPVTIKQSLLDSTLSTFADKATKEKALLQSAPVITDPSK